MCKSQFLSGFSPLILGLMLSVTANAGDFDTRCSAPGVVRCVDFDSDSDIVGTYGDNFGILEGNADPEIDYNIKASGAGALKLIIPSNSGANSSGAFFTNFSDDLTVQFDSGDTFYVQWRQRFSRAFLETNYAGGGGWKQVILGTGDKPGCEAATSAQGKCYSSCTDLELVAQNTNHRGYAQMYNSCSGSATHGPYDGFYEPFGSFDYKMQNARPAPFCLYSQGNDATPPNGNCFGYFADEWMTFQIGVELGQRSGDEWKGSQIKMWIAREGQPSELVMDYGPYNLTAGSASENQKYGKVWLLSYNTGKSSGQSHPEGYTWYDDLIISTQKIADPGAGSRPNPPLIID